MNKGEFIERINSTGNFKEKFLLVAEAMTGDNRNIELYEKIFLRKWLDDKPESYSQVVATITRIRDL